MEPIKKYSCQEKAGGSGGGGSPLMLFPKCHYHYLLSWRFRKVTYYFLRVLTFRKIGPNRLSDISETRKTIPATEDGSTMAIKERPDLDSCCEMRSLMRCGAVFATHRKTATLDSKSNLLYALHRFL
jgi:hypothetical protein